MSRAHSLDKGHIEFFSGQGIFGQPTSYVSAARRAIVNNSPDSTVLAGDGVAAALERARRLIGEVSLQLDTGLIARAPTDATTTLAVASQLLETIGEELRTARADDGASDTLLFDVSDLFAYYPDNRLPTGIQRVQISLILAFLDAPDGWRIGLVRFVEGRDQWINVPAVPFSHVCRLSMADGDPTAADWRAAVAEVERAIACQPVMVFPRGVCLVNLGTSWWLPNYFGYIRQAKAESGIRYVPLIHDVIPIIRPDECHPDLVHSFIDWFWGVLQHSDFFLANSESTKADFIKFAAQLGKDVPADMVGVVPFQADLVQIQRAPCDPSAILSNWGLTPGSFVLFVSTLEVRKNQLGAFDAWQRLIGIHGKNQVPQLVCVGKKGYRNGDILARRDASVDLQDKVLILERVDDAALEALYQHCLFTLFPSFYEGWGLPITESLRYGKVPLTADNSSLPQAGAGFSVMFRTGSNTALLAALEQLIYDPGFRKAKEAAIKKGFTLRSWIDVGRNMGGLVRAFLERAAAGPEGWTPVTAMPGFYPMVRNRELKLDARVGSAEIFRDGPGWWRLEDFGCWSRLGGGRLCMVLPPRTQRLALEVHGLPTQKTTFTIQMDGQVASFTGAIAAGQRKWVFLPIADASGKTVTRIHLIGHLTEIVVDPATSQSRQIGIGLCGFFVFDPDNPRARLDFLEAAALGGLEDYRHSTLR